MDEFLDKLPESLQTIVRLSDLTTALALVQKFGGQNFHFPSRKMINEQHELAKLIGFNNLKQLCQYYDGDTIYLPLAAEYAQFLRAEKIRQDSKTMSTNELSSKYGMSNRWINALKKRFKEPECENKKKKDDRQLDMFS